jgi:hypothetical protein
LAEKKIAISRAFTCVAYDDQIIQPDFWLIVNRIFKLAYFLVADYMICELQLNRNLDHLGLDGLLPTDPSYAAPHRKDGK